MVVLAVILTLAFLFFLGLYVYILVQPRANGLTKFFSRKVGHKKIIFGFIPILAALTVGIGMTSPDNQQASLQTEQIPNSIPSTVDDLAKVESAKVVRYHEVESVVDGDTIRVIIDDEDQLVRLIGIDSPEKTHPRKPMECFGQEAYDYLESLLNDKKVALVKDESQSDKDKYGRMLRYVYLEDGTDVNLRMIKDGYAFEYTYGGNPYKQQEEFIAAQASARKDGKGLWAQTACNGERKPKNTPRWMTEEPAPGRVQGSQSAPAPEAAPEPHPASSPTEQAADCDPDYSPCIPNVGYDLNCKQIKKRVQVIGNDRHGFDRDRNGIGCESYR